MNRSRKTGNLLTRRGFLKKSAIGVVSAGTLPWYSEKTRPPFQGKMSYVSLGRTGFQVSNLGFGGSRGNTEPAMIAYAANQGINYFDTSEGYRGGNSEVMIGKGVKEFREKVFITTKIGSIGGGGRITRETSKENIWDRAMGCLRRLDTPYIDCLMIHGAGDPDFGGFDNPHVWEVFHQLKSEGKVRFFGFSSHHYNLVEMARYAIQSNKIDVMLIAYNFLQRHRVPEAYRHRNWLQELDAVFQLARAKNIGVVTMKTLQGAQAAGGMENGSSTLATKLAAAKWALNNPRIHSTLISFSTFAEIDAFTAVSQSKMNQKDREALEEVFIRKGKEVCRIGCPAPCLNKCPYGVSIPDVFRIHMYYEEYGLREKARLEYISTVAENKQAGLCNSCTIASCDKECLFGIPVRERLITSHFNLGRKKSDFRWEEEKC